MGWWNTSEKDENLKKEAEKDAEKDAEEESEDIETYETNFECNNCRNEVTEEIPCGVTVKEALKDKKCDYCECNLMAS